MNGSGACLRIVLYKVVGPPYGPSPCGPQVLDHHTPAVALTGGDTDDGVSYSIHEALMDVEIQVRSTATF